jgi:Ca-activated chloride channel family protein
MTQFLEAFHFLRPWALLLAVPALLLWFAGRQAADTTRRWAAVMDADLLRVLTVGGQHRSFGPLDVLLLGWLAATLAIAGPTWQREPSPFADATPPAMIVLKVTPSMTTPDLAPSRLDRARQKIADILAQRDGMPAGLIAYSGSAHLVLPPTPDRDVVSSLGAALSPAIMPREGDRLADAVKLAARTLRDGGQGGSILVLADTATPTQVEALKGAAEGYPVTLLAMAPPNALAADANLKAAADAVDARLVPTSIDSADVREVASRLARGSAAMKAGDETERWQETGYWLTPLIALLVLGWFRRGWVLAS